MSGHDALQVVVGLLGTVSGAGLLLASQEALRCRDYAAAFTMILFGLGGIAAGAWLVYLAFAP